MIRSTDIVPAQFNGWYDVAWPGTREMQFAGAAEMLLTVTPLTTVSQDHRGTCVPTEDFPTLTMTFFNPPLQALPVQFVFNS